MSLKKTFVTIFPDSRNFHLVKDVGQVPYFMYKTEGYDAHLVCYQNDTAYPFLENEVQGLKLDFIPNRGRFLYFEKAILSYLWTFSRSIDVLHLFHFKKDHLLYLLLYKALNPRGKAYLKLDIDIKFFRRYNTFLYSKLWLKKLLLNGITKCIFRLTDVFSVESEEARSHLLKVYPQLAKKLIVMPNGVDNLFLDKTLKLRSLEEKEDIIINIGRIGTFQKNTELLLDALTKVELNNWSVYIIGPVEESFNDFLEDYYRRNPEMSEKVFLTGNITSRKEIFEWYNRAKIFCLSSRFEGFPIVFPEAIYFGNYIISTPVSGSLEITANGQLGKITAPEITDFAAAIEDSIRPGFLNAARFDDTVKFSRKHFTWPAIVAQLSAKLKQDA